MKVKHFSCRACEKGCCNEWVTAELPPHTSSAEKPSVAGLLRPRMRGALESQPAALESAGTQGKVALSERKTSTTSCFRQHNIAELAPRCYGFGQIKIGLRAKQRQGERFRQPQPVAIRVFTRMAIPVIPEMPAPPKTC